MSTAFTAAQVAVSLAFLALLAAQEISRAVGTPEAIRFWYRMEPHVYRSGVFFFAIIFWRFIELAS